jgi:hypothetical protein
MGKIEILITMRINHLYMRILYASFAFLLFFILVIRGVIYCQKKRSDKPATWKETIGTLDPQGHGEGTIQYNVDGVQYHNVFKGISNKWVEEQKYTMRYNVNDPKEIQVDNWNPVFIESESTHTFPARVKKVQSPSFFSHSAAVIYSYKVNRHEIEQWIYLPRDYKQRYPNLQENQYYQVECWDKNIYRSVLHLDKPINTL